MCPLDQPHLGVGSGPFYAFLTESPSPVENLSKLSIAAADPVVGRNLSVDMVGLAEGIAEYIIDNLGEFALVGTSDQLLGPRRVFELLAADPDSGYIYLLVTGEDEDRKKDQA